VNGGVWKTYNIHTNEPRWFPSTDQTAATCSSIAALVVDWSNTNRLVAGCGNPSNFMSYSSQSNGLLMTLDGGLSWTTTAFPGSSVSKPSNGYNVNLMISGVVLPAGTTILVGVRREYYGDFVVSNSVNRGIWRSIDQGVTWYGFLLFAPFESLNDV
jgi:hypothetical protein